MRRERVNGAILTHAAPLPVLHDGTARPRRGLRLRHASDNGSRVICAPVPGTAPRQTSSPDCPRQVPDFAGGTRIGEVLGAFNRHWARRVLGHGAVVLMISDGWDRGEPDLLAREMARLHRSSHRLIWLNPLLGSDNYEPLTRGLQAALPHIDDFLTVHNPG